MPEPDAEPGLTKSEWASSSDPDGGINSLQDSGGFWKQIGALGHDSVGETKRAMQSRHLMMIGQFC